ncbi:MAG TPA: endonuclease Q family protein, partial [Candidatus Eisenbacteria bacterium]|nr:endonuclease Q family protein [Candidatus Eisenbacteria bacterium]
MRFYADLHVHSKYSRACSKDCDLEHMAWWAALKGVAVVGTGDFTHPAWAEELRAGLVPAEPGLHRLREELEREVLRRLPAPCRTPVRFLLSTEISTISKRGDRTRKVHHLLFAPDLAAVGEITRRLARVGNLAADGRPILGLDPRDLLDITLAGGPGCCLVPAHVWTPWFSALGSRSGFDSIDECYADLAGHIFAAETGLSSDPAMNWRVSALDRYRLVSNSDAHSPPMLGREATVFDCGLDYFAILDALRTGEGLDGTVEFFPEEGKYHLDGHRACGVRLEPDRTRELAGRCPTCGKPLTVGVLHRVEELADRPEGHRPDGARGYRCLISLSQVLGELLDVGPRSKAVTGVVGALVNRLGPEFGILTDVPLEDLARLGPPLLSEALDRLRRGAVMREAGYDGVYGTIRLFTAAELAAASGPMLFDLAIGPPDPEVAPRRAGPCAPGADELAAPLAVDLPARPAAAVSPV